MLHREETRTAMEEIRPFISPSTEAYLMKPALLIADGDPVQLMALGQQLYRQGYEVDTAAGGLECLGKLRRGGFDLLVLNLELPWGGGEGVLAVVREDPELRRIPVILTSAEASPAFLYGQVTPPVVRALWKPFSQFALLEGVRFALQKQNGTRPEEKSLPWAGSVLLGKESFSHGAY